MWFEFSMTHGILTLCICLGLPVLVSTILLFFFLRLARLKPTKAFHWVALVVGGLVLSFFLVLASWILHSSLPEPKQTLPPYDKFAGIWVFTPKSEKMLADYGFLPMDRKFIVQPNGVCSVQNMPIARNVYTGEYETYSMDNHCSYEFEPDHHTYLYIAEGGSPDGPAEFYIGGFAPAVRVYYVLYIMDEQTEVWFQTQKQESTP